MVANIAKTNTTISKKGACWFRSPTKTTGKKNMGVPFQLIGNPKYFHGKPHI